MIDLFIGLGVAAALLIAFLPAISRQARYSRVAVAAAMATSSLLLFLVSWNGGLWLAPMGPLLWGTYWSAFVLAGVLLALMLGLFFQRRARRRRQGRAAAEGAAIGAGALYWLLLTALIMAVAVTYIV